MKIRYRSFAPLANNCYLIIDEATNASALVDCSEYNEKMRELIGETDLKYILLTHGHFDHIGGVREVKERYGAQVCISAEDALMLKDGRQSLAFFSGGVQKNVVPDRLLKEGDIIALGSLEIRVLHTPGHTKGGLCYLVEDALFTGDTLFCCSCGRTDFPGGSTREILASLYRLRSLDGDYKVYPGHDDLSTLAYEREHNPYMKM